jgi:hypothetical protein
MARTITSPRGVLEKYAALTAPDYKFDAAGAYKCKQVLQLNEQTQAYIKTIEDAYETAYKAEAVAKGKKVKRADMPWEINEEEGTVTFSYKLKAQIINGKTKEAINRKVKIFDGAGKLIPNASSIKIGGGTVAKLAFQPYFWPSATLGYGMTLQLEACQIIQLVEFGAGEGDYEFGAEDDGFDGGDVRDDAPFGAEEPGNSGGDADEY